MCLQLPYQQNRFTLYCDNLFSNIPLFHVLGSYGISACGTACTNSAEFPEVLKVDKKKAILPWDTLSGVQVRDVLAILWQDNKLVRLLTTAHSCQEDDRKNRYSRGPWKTSHNQTTVQSVWGSEAHKNLSVPALTADYNDKMGGVDIADQRRTYYATQPRVARNWMSQIWLSKVDFTWLIVISHRYVLCFTLLSQLTHSIWHDDTIVCHWFIVISCLVLRLTIVSYMMYDFRIWLIVMSHGFRTRDPLRTHDLFYELWLV